MIGARGSGQEPQENGGVDPSQYEADPYNGMGIENYTVYQRLAATHPQLQIDYEGVQYGAEKVLTGDLTEPSLLSIRACTRTTFGRVLAGWPKRSA